MLANFAYDGIGKCLPSLVAVAEGLVLAYT